MTFKIIPEGKHYRAVCKYRSSAGRTHLEALQNLMNYLLKYGLISEMVNEDIEGIEIDPGEIEETDFDVMPSEPDYSGATTDDR